MFGVGFYVGVLRFIWQFYSGEPFCKGGIEIVLLPHIDERLALRYDGVGRVRCHEQTGFRLCLFKFQNRVKILRGLGQQFQIGIDIGLAVELIFLQQYGKLCLCPGHGRQRFFVECVRGKRMGGGHIIFKNIVGQLIFFR